MKEKLQTIFKNKKTNYILGAVALLLLLSFVFILKPSSANVVGTYPDQIVDNLSFKEAKLSVEGEVSTYKVNVENTSSTNKELSLIEIHLKDERNQELEVLYGYIGESLSSKEVRELTASIDKDFKEATSVEYIIK